MLKIAVIEDEHTDLAKIVANILAFEERDRISVKPFWIQNEYAESYRYEHEIEVRLEELVAHGINVSPLPVEVFEGLDLSESENRELIIKRLSEHDIKLVFCDAGMGTGGKENREAGLKLVEDILKKSSDADWRCQIISNYAVAQIVADREKYVGFPLERYYIDKRNILNTPPGRCDKQLADVLKDALNRTAYENAEYYGSIFGKSENMQDVFHLIDAVAPAECNILILGEHGTGKELVANEIHHNSPRRNKPFIKVNCAALPKELIESELFGHTKGAFTGATTEKAGLIAQADGGSLLLDEIAEMPLELQPKLLRVLQEKTYTKVGSEKPQKVDFRLIAATNRDPAEAIEKGLLREDLFYRINTVTITLPPLRERAQDIPILAYKFVEAFSRKYQRDKKLSPEALRDLQNRDWKGNIRQLEHTIERAVLVSRNERIEAEDLDLAAAAKNGSASSATAEAEDYDLSKMEADDIWFKLVKSGKLTFDLSDDKNGPRWWKSNKDLATKVVIAALKDLKRLPRNDDCKQWFGLTTNAFKNKLGRDGIFLENII